MPNPLYQMFMGQSMQPTFQNPIQKMNYIMQAMTNPAQFVKRTFPDIPDQIANDPNQILQYLQRTRNISDNQIQQIINQIPGGRF